MNMFMFMLTAIGAWVFACLGLIGGLKMNVFMIVFLIPAGFCAYAWGKFATGDWYFDAKGDFRDISH